MLWCSDESDWDKYDILWYHHLWLDREGRQPGSLSVLSSESFNIFLVNDGKNLWSICQPCDTVINNVSWFAESLTYICHNVMLFCHLFTFPYSMHYSSEERAQLSNNHSFFVVSDFKAAHNQILLKSPSHRTQHATSQIIFSDHCEIENLKPQTQRGSDTTKKVSLGFLKFSTENNQAVKIFISKTFSKRLIFFEKVWTHA